MRIIDLGFVGVKEIIVNKKNDLRGSFKKTFNDSFYKTNNINFEIKEQYISYSKKNVVRGMHFQLPPSEHDKLVFCISGKVLDVILDIRKESETYGKSSSVILDAERGNGLYIPKGFAHGFLSLEEQTGLLYNVSSCYDAKMDTGIRWDSFGFNWGINNPIVSDRDSEFISFSDFDSPFGSC